MEYKDYPNLQRLIGEIGWGQNLDIMAKVKDAKAREFYLRTTIEMGWTRDVLAIQIASLAYERQIKAKKQHNFALALPKHLSEQANYLMKDVYMLDMLGITKPVGVAEFRLTRKLPQELRNKLPNVKELENAIFKEFKE